MGGETALAAERLSRRLNWLIIVVAAAWCVATLVFVLAWSSFSGRTFTGAYAGLFPGDQFRYLAWIREAALHGLIADPYRAGASHMYLHPLFLISGLLWRAGVSIQAAYLVWTPLALFTLIWGYSRFATRYLVARERTAALALALLYFSPLVPLLDYGQIVNANGANYLVIAASHGAPYWQAWGFLPTLLALGLMPVFLLGVEAIMRAGQRRRFVAMTGIAGLLVAWLHPWGGLELLLILAGLVAMRGPPPCWRDLLFPAVLTSLPLIYYIVLARADSAWSLSRLRVGTSGPVWPLVIGYGPLVLLAFHGARRRETPGAQILGLWLVAVVLTYLVLPSSRNAALEGVSLPLSILAVRGWRRLPNRPRLAWAALLIAIVPGAFYSAHTFHDLFRSHDYPYALAGGEQRAVNSLGRLPGKVLATPYLGVALPATAGRSVELTGNVRLDDVFDGRASPAVLAHLVDLRQVRVVISDCLRGRTDLSQALGRIGFVEARYGCARVYQHIGR